MDSWAKNALHSFYFVQITDSDGCLINDFNEVNLPAGKVSQTIENDVVSTVTNEYNPLEVTKKLSAIYTF